MATIITFDGRHETPWPSDAHLPKQGETIINENLKDRNGRPVKGVVQWVRHYIKDGEVKVEVSVTTTIF